MISGKIISLLLSGAKGIDREKELHSVSDWKRHVFANLVSYDTWFDRAVVGGFCSDRLAYVFLSGYQCALHTMFPLLAVDKIAAFCVSEKGGNAPRAIQTKFRKVDSHYTATGTKTFVTCAEEVDILLIAARDSDIVSDRPSIKVFYLDSSSEGVLIKEDKVLPFMPELKRGRLTISNCSFPEEQMLDGDGYSEAIKPFSPLETLYIMAAGVAYMMRLASLYEWPDLFLEQSLAVLTAIQGANSENPEAAENQILIAGLKEQIKGLVLLTEQDEYWRNVDLDTQKRWLRDKVMLMMPDKAHSVRQERAWQHFRTRE